MTFPRVILGLTADISLTAGQWTPVTDYVYQRDEPAVTITRGKPDETAQISPSSATVKVDNRDGRFSFRNPLGAWYGRIGKNTPVRVGVPDQGTYLRIEDDATAVASCPDTAGISVTGDTDIRADVNLSDWSGGILASKWTPGTGETENSWVLVLNTDGTLSLFWSSTGSDDNTAQSTVPLPVTGRQCIRVTLQVSSGDVTFYAGPAGGAAGSTWTQLGGVAGSAGETSVYNSTAALAAGNYAGGGLPAYGACYELVLMSGIAGTIKADAVFSAQAAGTTSFTDAQGNTWTMGGTAEISDRSYRFHGEMSSSPKAQDPTGTDLYVPLTCGGILRRLQQGDSPEYSPMRRAIQALSGDLAVRAYWPCEDLQGATSIGSATGGPIMTVTGGTGDGSTTTTGPAFAADSSFACSNPLPTVNGSSWRGDVPAYDSNGSIIVRFLMNVQTAPGNGARIMRVITTGTCMEFSVYYGTGGALGLTGYDSGGNLVFDTGNVAFAVSAQPVWVSMELQPGTGSTVDYSLVTLIPGGAEAVAWSGTFTGTIGNATAVLPAPTRALTGVTIGHVSVQDTWQSLFDLFQPLNAWIGETAGNRFIRLCSENSLGCRLYGYPAVTAAMGAQPVDTLPDLLQQCEDADRGMQYEPRQAYAIGYRTLASLCNQAPAVTLSYTGADLAAAGYSPPADDDQYTMNDMTVTRDSGGDSAQSGAQYRLFLDDGSPMSVSPPPGGVGDYASTLDANVEADAQLPDLAGWTVHLGTVSEERWPAIPVDLARTQMAALFWALQDVNIGDYVAVSDPPSWLTPDVVRQIVSGCSEELGGYTWRIGWNGIPESPYETAIFDDAVYGRADTDGSTLHAAVSSTATTLSVASTSTALPLWTTASSDFPFDISIAGEQITVTGISGTSSPQSFTVTRSVNGVVKAQAAGADVRLFFPPVLALI